MSTATETQEVESEDSRDARYAVLDGRSAKALALACSTDESRPVLESARIRPDGVFEATDGHLLTRMVPNLKDSDGSFIREDIEEVPGWRIHRNDLKRPKVSEFLRLDLESGELVVLDKNGNLEIAIPGGATNPEEAEFTYPDTDRIYNAEERDSTERVTVALAGRYLKALAKMAKAADKRSEQVVMSIRNCRETQEKEGTTTRSVLWSIGNEGAQTGVEGLLMPMRVNR